MKGNKPKRHLQEEGKSNLFESKELVKAVATTTPPNPWKMVAIWYWSLYGLKETGDFQEDEKREKVIGCNL